MEHRFHKHYTREEARALLPQVRQWLQELNQAHRELERGDRRLGSLRKSGCDVGGDLVNQWVRALARMRQLLATFQERQIIVKDLERGLVDFPAILAGKEVFLCWEQDEEDIEFWHDLDTGYAGRERL